MAFPFYEDEDILDRLVRTLLLGGGADCLSTEEAGRRGSPDAIQLEFATAQGRVIVTFNHADFGRLHSEWMAAGREHSGIVIVTDQNMSRVLLAQKLLRLWAERTPDQMRNAILFVNSNPIEEPQ